MISLLPLMIGTGMPVVWDAFFGLSLIKAKFWIVTWNFIFNTYYTWLGWSLYFPMKAITLSARKFENWSSEQGSFGMYSFFNNVTEVLVESIAINLVFWKNFSFPAKLIISLWLKVVSATFLLVCFVFLKKKHFRNKEKCFLFHSK